MKSMCQRAARFFKAGMASACIFLLCASSVNAAGLLIADGGFGGVLEIEEHSVDVTINNGIAVTAVNQVFRNTENREVEALYTFPVPKGASVSNFSMWIGGKEMIGEVVEKERAREIYNSYKQRRRDPGLLEQTSYKSFEMRIFPIAPKAEQRVQVTYYQELDFDNDWGTYVYPLATVTQTGVNNEVKGRFSFNLEVKSEVPIVAMESPSHSSEFAIARHTDIYHQASLETSGGDLSRDLVVAYQISRPRTGIDLVASKTGGEDGHFCLTIMVGEELADTMSGMDYVFILDISGSMANDGKLRLSRNSLGAFVNALTPEDRFELITFNVTPNTLFDAVAPVNEETKTRATEFLSSQQARGGTILHPAITAAYRYGDPDRPLVVVVLSDGMTKQEERAELIQLVSQRPSNARVFCIGVGNEVNRPLLSQLAEDTGGLAAFVSHGDNFERQARAFRRKLMHPVAADLDLQIDGLETYDLEPRKLPNLYHGVPVRLYGRYKDGGIAKINLSAEVRGAPFATAVELEFPDREANNHEIERMWAWHKMDRLLKDADRSGARDAVLDEIVRLGEGYSIASEYTSFIVLENDAEFARWKIERRNALRVARDRRTQREFHARLEELRRKAFADIGPEAVKPRVEKQTLASAKVPVSPGQSVSPPSASVPSRQSAPVERSRGADFDVPFGGGAFDPITGGVAIAIGGLALLAGRRKR